MFVSAEAVALRTAQHLRRVVCSRDIRVCGGSDAQPSRSHFLDLRFNMRLRGGDDADEAEVKEDEAGDGSTAAKADEGAAGEGAVAEEEEGPMDMNKALKQVKTATCCKAYCTVISLAVLVQGANGFSAIGFPRTASCRGLVSIIEV